MQASTPGELRGEMGRLGYLSAGGRMAKFVVDAGCSLQMGSCMSAADQPLLVSAGSACKLYA